MVPEVSRAMLNRIERLIEASMELAFIGAQAPEDHTEIEREFHAARFALEVAIERKKRT